MLGALIAAASLLAFPPLDHQPDTPPFVVSCLGTDRIAADMSALTKLHAASSAEAWDAACRDALDANRRRLALTRGLFMPGAAPSPDYSSAQSFRALADQSTDPALAELFSRSARDQAIRASLSMYAPAYSASLSPASKSLLDALVAGDAVASDADNRQWLRRVVQTRGWFTITRDGPQADRAAWLMVQHSDADRDFQHDMIKVLEPLVASHETSGVRFGSLYDRWAEGAGQPQRYGLGGDCKGPGRWEPRQIEDVQAVDQRRAAAGFDKTEAQFIADMSADCR